MSKKRMTDLFNRPEYYAERDAAYDAALEALLNDPRPAEVSLPHFMARDLNARIAAGECIITVPDRIAGSAKMHTVAHVGEAMGLSKRYDVTTTDNRIIIYTSATLNIEWLSTNAPNQAATIDHMTTETFTLDMSNLLRAIALAALDMANILQVIAAVAADNLMHNKITETDRGWRLVIMDGLGNELSEPVVLFGKRPIVEKAGEWYRMYRYGEFNQNYPGSLGDGKGVAYRFSRMGEFDARLRNQGY